MIIATTEQFIIEPQDRAGRVTDTVEYLKRVRDVLMQDRKFGAHILVTVDIVDHDKSPC